MFYRRSLLFLLFVLALVVVPAATAQEGLAGATWSQPEELGPGWFPSITVDRTDTAHLAWHRGNAIDGHDMMLYTKRSATENAAPNDVIYTGYGGFTIRAAIDVSPEGLLYTMYRAKSRHELASADLNNSQDPVAWNKIVDFGNNAYYLDMLVDDDGIIHAISGETGTNLVLPELQELDPAAITEHIPCAYCSDLIYRRSEDGGNTWFPIQNLSKTIDGSERPHIFQGPSGRIYVSWSEGFDWYVYAGDYMDGRFIYSDDGGRSWSDPVVLTGAITGLSITQFNLTEMLDGTLLAVWRYVDYSITPDLNIYYQISSDDGETWTDPEAIPGIMAFDFVDSLLDHYALVTDLTGAVHLFAVGTDPVTLQGPAIYDLEYRQGRWLRPIRVYYDATGSGTNPEWPAVAVGPRNDIHLTWFVRGTTFNRTTGRTNADLKVYYSRRGPTLPEEYAIAQYEPTATPFVAAFVPNFEPTPVPLPTLAPLDPKLNSDASKDLYAIEILLAGVLAVSALCVVVLLASGFRPRFF